MRMLHTLTSINPSSEAKVSSMTLCAHDTGQKSFDILFEDVTYGLLAMSTVRLTLTHEQALALASEVSRIAAGWNDHGVFRDVSKAETQDEIDARLSALPDPDAPQTSEAGE